MDKYAVTMDGNVPEPAEIARLLGEADFGPMPRAADRDAWAAIAARPWVSERMPRLLEHARRAAQSDPLPVKATDYLSFFRTGLRDAHNASAGRRSAMLSVLTVAECLEHEGRFLDALLDVSWAIAEETSWIMPPHLMSEGGRQLPDVADPRIDLRVATLGKLLGQMVYLLGPEMDAISPMWRRRINFEVRRQVIDPYLNGTFWWMTTTSNWNAVCTDGVVAAALLADFDAQTRVRVLHKAFQSVHHFLSGFTPDGGCTEGPGYWSYGVSNYCSLAYWVHCATGGKIDLLADPLVPRVLGYPTGIVLSGSKVAAFADCPLEVRFRSGAVAWAAEQARVPEMTALASGGRTSRAAFTAALDVCLLPEPRDFAPPEDRFLPDLMLLVARGGGAEGGQLVLAVKGGHNNEHHNHNDVGAFIVHWQGESLICDLGAGNYTRQLFGPERYELLSTRSCGHNVPLVNGIEQATGRDFRAADFKLDERPGAIGVSMELAGAYPAGAGLRSLGRCVTLNRAGDESVELVDHVVFAGDARRYELPLYTEGTFEAVGEGLVQARANDAAIGLEFDPEVVEAEIEMVAHGDARFARHFGDELPRCTLRLRGSPQQATVRLRFVPVR